MNSSTNVVNAFFCVTLVTLAGAVGVAVGAGGMRRIQKRPQPVARTHGVGRQMIRTELPRRGRIPRQLTPDRALHDQIPGGSPDSTGTASP